MDGPMTSPPYTIKLATTDDERQAIYRLRYRVCQMRRPQIAGDHAQRTISDALDTFGLLWGVWSGDDCIGTLRTNLLRDGHIGEYDGMYGLHTLSPRERHRTSITSRLIVLPELRRTTLALELATAALILGNELGILHDYIDCDAHLVPLFSGLGYVPHRTDLVHPACGAVTVMHLAIDDTEHLEAVRSPLLDAIGRRKMGRPPGDRIHVPFAFEPTMGRA